jgi:hypothetical protein
MKKVFTVTLSHDEPPTSQVADEASEALHQAKIRFSELEIPTNGRPNVTLDGEHPDFDDFCAKYTLVRNPFDSSAAIGGTALGWVGAEWETVRSAAPEKVWTLVESEELWWITPGLHHVKRVGYLPTNEARAGEENNYLYD